MEIWKLQRNGVKLVNLRSDPRFLPSNFIAPTNRDWFINLISARATTMLTRQRIFLSLSRTMIFVFLRIASLFFSRSYSYLRAIAFSLPYGTVDESMERCGKTEFNFELECRRLCLRFRKRNVKVHRKNFPARLFICESVLGVWEFQLSTFWVRNSCEGMLGAATLELGRKIRTNCELMRRGLTVAIKKLIKWMKFKKKMEKNSLLYLASVPITSSSSGSGVSLQDPGNDLPNNIYRHWMRIIRRFRYLNINVLWFSECRVKAVACISDVVNRFNFFY